MKKYLIGLIAIFTLGSCDIDLEPESSLVYTGYWQSEEALIANHAGIYDRFRRYNYTLWTTGELRSDIWGGRTLESPSNVDFINVNYSVDTAPYGNWADFYGFMHNLNDFIKNAERINTEESDLNHMYGQVYGLRAFTYFNMLKIWGEVPIVTEPLPPDFDPNNVKTLGVVRSSKDEVLAQVQSDLEKSLEYFGDDNSYWKGKNIYWSKNATLALKGEAYLWAGSVLDKGQENYQTALGALEDIDGPSLVDEFSNLWGSSNDNNREFIFAIDYQVDQSTNFYRGVFTGRNVDIRPNFDRFGNSMSSSVFNGSNRYGVTSDLMNKLIMSEAEGDARSQETFTYLFSDDNGYDSFVDEKYKASILKKFPGEEVGSDIIGISNVPIYRYADILLLIAEAKNELGQNPSDEINQVRARAYGEDFDDDIAYNNGSYDDNKEAILNERLIEFIGEGKRFWDLVRAGEDKLVKYKPEFEGNLYKVYLPITRGMLSNDQFMTQTEGYPE